MTFDRTEMTQTIEQLQAKVAELEEEKKELQALLDFDNAKLDQIEDELEDVEYLGPYVEGIKVLKKRLAAAQEEIERLNGQISVYRLSFVELERQRDVEMTSATRWATGYHELRDQLAAEQLNNKLLRVALTTCVCAMQDYQAGIGITEMFDTGERLGRKALSSPASTEALDAYVKQKIKEYY